MKITICDFCKQPKLFNPSTIKIKIDDESLGIFPWEWKKYDICECCYSKMRRYIEEKINNAE